MPARKAKLKMIINSCHQYYLVHISTIKHIIRKPVHTSDPKHILDVVDIIVLPVLRLLGFTYNGATVHDSKFRPTDVQGSI